MTDQPQRWSTAREAGQVLTLRAASTDTQALMDLAGWYRGVDYQRRYGRFPDADELPGLRATAIQIEWAAREIDRLREETP